jgi:hypothetical protein
MTCKNAIWAALIVAKLSVSLIADEPERWGFVDQTGGKCQAQDFGKQRTSRFPGIRAWFGTRLVLRTSFYVASEPWGRNSICADGNYLGGELPIYGCYNVTFFDADDNLLAAEGARCRLHHRSPEHLPG